MSPNVIKLFSKELEFFTSATRRSTPTCSWSLLICLLCISELLWLCRVMALKSLPVHSFNALIIPVLRGCLQSHFNIENLHADRTIIGFEPWQTLRARLDSRKTGLRPPPQPPTPSTLILTVPRRYFCCGSLLLLVLAVRIYTFVQLLC